MGKRNMRKRNKRRMDKLSTIDETPEIAYISDEPAKEDKTIEKNNKSLKGSASSSSTDKYPETAYIGDQPVKRDKGKSLEKNNESLRGSVSSSSIARATKIAHIDDQPVKRDKGKSIEKNNKSFRISPSSSSTDKYPEISYIDDQPVKTDENKSLEDECLSKFINDKNKKFFGNALILFKRIVEELVNEHKLVNKFPPLALQFPLSSLENDEEIKKKIREFDNSIWKLEAIQDIYGKINDHDFHKKLFDGTLPKEVFEKFKKSDITYMRSSALAWYLLYSRVDDQERAELYFARCLRTLEMEWNLARQFMTREERKNKDSYLVSTNYNRHLINFAALGTEGEAIAALLPCYRVFNKLWEDLTEKGKIKIDSEYKKWINPEYTRPIRSASKLVAIFYSYYSKLTDTDMKANAVKIWRQSVKLELGILESCMGKEDTIIGKISKCGLSREKINILQTVVDAHFKEYVLEIQSKSSITPSTSQEIQTLSKSEKGKYPEAKNMDEIFWITGMLIAKSRVINLEKKLAVKRLEQELAVKRLKQELEKKRLEHQKEEERLEHQKEEERLEHQKEEAPLKHKLKEKRLKHQKEEKRLEQKLEAKRLEHQKEEARLKQKLEDSRLDLEDAEKYFGQKLKIKSSPSISREQSELPIKPARSQEAKQPKPEEEKLLSKFTAEALIEVSGIRDKLAKYRDAKYVDEEAMSDTCSDNKLDPHTESSELVKKAKNDIFRVPVSANVSPRTMLGINDDAIRTSSDISPRVIYDKSDESSALSSSGITSRGIDGNESDESLSQSSSSVFLRWIQGKSYKSLALSSLAISQRGIYGDSDLLPVQSISGITSRGKDGNESDESSVLSRSAISSSWTHGNESDESSALSSSAIMYRGMDSDESDESDESSVTRSTSSSFSRASKAHRRLSGSKNTKIPSPRSRGE